MGILLCFIFLVILLYFIFLVILLFLIEKITIKFLGVEKKRISETAGKKVDQWRRGILLVVFLCTFPFFIAKDKNVLKVYWILFFVLTLGSQSILEWKYLKSTKQYVTTLIFLVVAILILYNIEYFFPLLLWW